MNGIMKKIDLLEELMDLIIVLGRLIMDILFYSGCGYCFYKLNVNLHRDIHKQYDVMKELYK